jgi:hypothetical protein
MLLTIEMPDESIVKLELKPYTTLKEISLLVGIENPVFFCDRWKGELGTLMSMHSSNEPIEKFNTNSIVLIDRKRIQSKDVPRYYCAMTKGY